MRPLLVIVAVWAVAYLVMIGLIAVLIRLVFVPLLQRVMPDAEITATLTTITGLRRARGKPGS